MTLKDHIERLFIGIILFVVLGFFGMLYYDFVLQAVNEKTLYVLTLIILCYVIGWIMERIFASYIK